AWIVWWLTSANFGIAVSSLAPVALGLGSGLPASAPWLTKRCAIAPGSGAFASRAHDSRSSGNGWQLSGEGGARTSASTTRGRDDVGPRDAPNRGIGPSTFWAAQDVSLGTFSAEIGATLVLPPEIVNRLRQGAARRESRSGS